MGKLVKCKICGKQIDKDNAYVYLHTSKTGKQYKWNVCSLEEVENDKREKELFRKIQLLTDEILGYPCVNNTRNKKIQELKDAGFSNETIFRCFKKYKDEIIKWIDVNGIDKEFNKLAYMFAVIGANIKDFQYEDAKINDWKQYKKVEEEVSEEEFCEAKEETEDDILNRLKNKKENTNNISSFLNNLK